MNYLFEIIGYFLIWVAVFIGRKEDSKLALDKKEYWIALILIVIGTFIIKKYGL